MEIKASKLREALDLLAPAVPKKTALPVTMNVRLGEGKALATNLEVQVVLRLPEAEGEPPLLLPHRQALEFLKAVPGDTQVTLSREGKKVLLQAGLTRLRLESAEAEEFPPVSQVEFAGAAEVDGDALVRTLEELTPYTAREESRPVITGICLTLGDPAEACAADGFRLAYRPLPFAVPPLEGGPLHLIIPRGTVRVVAHLWRKAGREPAIPPDGLLVQMLTARRPIRLRYSGKAMELAFGNVTLTAQMVEGIFPSYHQLIPQVFYSHVSVMGEELERALRQVIPVAGSDIIRLRWGDGNLVLSAQGEEVGEAEVMVSAKTEGEPGRIAFGQKYLAEYLRGRYQPVTIQVSSPSSPALLTSADAPVVVVMPMFVQWDGGAAQKEPPTEEAPVPPAGEEAEAEAVAAPEAPETPEAPVTPEPEEPPKPKSRRGRKKHV